MDSFGVDYQFPSDESIPADHQLVPVTGAGFPAFTVNSVSLYIQMELCESGSLRDVLRQYDLPLSVRMDYFRQVGLAGGSEV